MQSLWSTNSDSLMLPSRDSSPTSRCRPPCWQVAKVYQAQWLTRAVRRTSSHGSPGFWKRCLSSPASERPRQASYWWAGPWSACGRRDAPAGRGRRGCRCPEVVPRVSSTTSVAGRASALVRSLGIDQDPSVKASIWHASELVTPACELYLPAAQG